MEEVFCGENNVLWYIIKTDALAVPPYVNGPLCFLIYLVELMSLSTLKVRH